jgi:hypothetical protein
MSDIEDRFQAAFKKLVPGDGPCETKEGEILRAIGRIQYRWYNDGDWWDEGYGCETVGPAVAFLHDILPDDLHKKVYYPLTFQKWDDNNGPTNLAKDEAEIIEMIKEAVTTYVEERIASGNLSPFTQDMFDWPPLREDEEEGW